MKIIRILSTAVCTASLIVSAGTACAQAAGTVLFAQEGAQIVSASGAARPARKGDSVQAGEQLTTPGNGISQIRLSDGSLIGVRPGSQLRIDAGASASTSGQSMSLLQGGVRVIGAELMDRQKPSSLTLQTGQATLQLNGADLESVVVRSAGRSDAGGDGRSEPRTGEPRPPVSGDPGSYNRLIAGAGSLRSGAAVEPLVPRQVNFVAAGNPVPMLLASMPPAPGRPGVPGNPAGPPPGGQDGPGAGKPPMAGASASGPPPAGGQEGSGMARAPMTGGLPPGPPPVGSPDGAAVAKPPLAGLVPIGPPPVGPGAMPVLSPMTSTLTAPPPGPGGSALGAPMPGGPPPNFSPIATATLPGGPKGPAPAMPVMMPVGGGAPGNMGPVGPPINMRPPVICTPSPIRGKPPICK